MSEDRRNLFDRVEIGSFRDDDAIYEWTVIGSIAPPEVIVCSPTVGRNGIEYVPDWHGITHFG